MGSLRVLTLFSPARGRSHPGFLSIAPLSPAPTFPKALHLTVPSRTVLVAQTSRDKEADPRTSTLGSPRSMGLFYSQERWVAPPTDVRSSTPGPHQSLSMECLAFIICETRMIVCALPTLLWLEFHIIHASVAK